jgi:hypothetical protein
MPEFESPMPDATTLQKFNVELTEDEFNWLCAVLRERRRWLKADGFPIHDTNAMLGVLFKANPTDLSNPETP